MRRFLAYGAAGLFCLAAAAWCAPVHNRLSAKERADGWLLLFDGKTMNHWIDPAAMTPPGDSWTIEDGCLKARPHPRITEDLVSADSYRDFELQWDWRIASGGNSGVKYRIQDFAVLTKANHDPHAHNFEDTVNYVMAKHLSDRHLIGPDGRGQVYVIGFEYQMIDNDRHPDAKRGGLYQTAALYSIVAPSQAVAKPVGEFNHSLLIVKGEHVEHWLNGVKVVDTMLDTQMLKDNLAKRWGKNSPVYHLMVDQPRAACPFSLQNHDDEVWFRDIKIKPL